MLCVAAARAFGTTAPTAPHTCLDPRIPTPLQTNQMLLAPRITSPRTPGHRPAGHPSTCAPRPGTFLPRISKPPTCVCSVSTDASLHVTASLLPCTFTLPAGNVEVRRMLDEDEAGAVVVLTRAFATQPGGLPIKDVSQYVREVKGAPPSSSVLLVARLDPSDPDARSRIVATASLSLSAVGRERFSTLQPPDDQALLANIAVDPTFRRQGVASQLLDVCEALARDAGLQCLYLHVRLADEGARALYAARGFDQVAKDSVLVSLRGRMPRALMCKRVVQ